MPIDRRLLLAALAGGLVAPTLARAASTVLELPVKGRTSKVTVWTPPTPKAVVVLSHGGNSSPDPYAAHAEWLVGLGYAVYAPLHSDSANLPKEQQKSLQDAFPERMADMATVTGYVAQRHAGLPIVAMGHSYGSLFALMLGGALTYVADLYNPAVKAVVTYSSPGAIPGLITPAAYATLTAPLLMVTGDKDVVPGFVADWKQHELPFEGTTIKESYELVITGGEHGLIAGAPAHRDLARQVTRDFLARELFASGAPLRLPEGAPALLRSKG